MISFYERDSEVRQANREVCGIHAGPVGRDDLPEAL